jgi:Beta-lactamase
MGDADDARAAPPGGWLFGTKRHLDWLLEGKFDCTKIPDVVSNAINAAPKRVASRIFLMSDKIVVGSSELGPRKNGHGRNVMSRWKLLAATTALAAMVVAATASLPICARELQPLATAAPEQVGMSAERLGRITTMLKKEIADGKLPGTVVMVARKGKIIYSDAIGFQDKGANTPMKLDSIFRIYSMTKPLASVAAMALVEDGVIQLTDPVAKFLPAFKDMQVSVATTGADGKTTYANVPAGRPIIVQDLLRHSAGLAYAEITKNEPVKAAYVEAKFSQPASTNTTPAA